MPTFCVTGASGFIGAEVTATLLAEGHTVRGTVRDTSTPGKYDYLTGLPGAEDRLSLHEADLTVDGSFDEAVQGCDYVLHTASPYVVDVEDPQRDLVGPAVDGTRNVLRSCLDVEDLRRVVVTSSLAAVTDEARDGHVFDENDWNTKSSLERNPYYYSKVQAEQAAWDFCTEHDPTWDLVVVNPSLVVGPARNPSLNESNQVLRDLADGHLDAMPAVEFVVVDVRDVARAHLLAATTEDANGRFLVTSDTRSYRQMAELIDATYASNNLPLRLDNPVGSWLLRNIGWRTLPSGSGWFVRTHVGRELRTDNGKSRTVLGMEYRDPDQSIVDAIDDMIERGEVTRTSR